MKTILLSCAALASSLGTPVTDADISAPPPVVRAAPALARPAFRHKRRDAAGNELDRMATVVRVDGPQVCQSVISETYASARAECAAAGLKLADGAVSGNLDNECSPEPDGENRSSNKIAYTLYFRCVP
jgi:hypothetical protein